MGTRIKAWRVHQDGWEDGDKGKGAKAPAREYGFHWLRSVAMENPADIQCSLGFSFSLSREAMIVFWCECE